MDFPIPPEFWWSTDILSSSIFLQGLDQKILLCGQGRIDGVKINPSLLMLRECVVLGGDNLGSDWIGREKLGLSERA